MTGQLPVEVEVLSEHRWAKIRTAVLAELESPGFQLARREIERIRVVNALRPRSKMRRVMPLLAAAALFVAALWVSGLGSGLSMEQAQLDQPSRITTGRSASFLALQGLNLDVAPESAVTVGPQTRDGMRIVVDRGGVVCDVAPRASDAPLIVEAGGVSVRVVGTRFSVTRDGDAARVQVYEGVVEVTAAGSFARVGAGEQWSARPATTRGDAEVDQRNVDHSSAAERLVDGQVQREARLSRQARQDRLETSRAPVAGASPGARTQEWPDHATEESAQAIFERATTLERSHPARSAELYRSLQGGADSWAQNSLYAHGRLAASRGQKQEARRLLKSYLKRFPTGSNVQDARAVLKAMR